MEGFTAYRRWKGRTFGREVAEIGESVWYMKPGIKGKDKFERRWEEGIWLGVRHETGEVIMGTSEGVIKVRDVKRRRRRGRREVEQGEAQ